MHLLTLPIYILEPAPYRFVNQYQMILGPAPSSRPTLQGELLHRALELDPFMESSSKIATTCLKIRVCFPIPVFPERGDSSLQAFESMLSLRRHQKPT